MKRMLALLLVVAVIAAVYFMRKSAVPSTLERDAANTSSESANAPAELVSDSPKVPELSLTESDQGPREPAATPLENPTEEATLRVRVFGVVQSDSGEPLAEVSLRFDTVNQPWSDSVPSTRDHPKFAVETDEEGHFEFDLPVPAAEYYSLKILPDPFHRSERRVFSDTRPGAEPLLQEGERDLGTLVVDRGGAIRGRVVDEQGVPIDWASVEIVGDEDRSCTSKEDGSFYWRGAPLGTYKLEASALSAIGKDTRHVDVRFGLELRDIDFVLQRREFIAGRVVDEEGNPVSGVSVVPSAGAGWRAGGGRSGEDGSFLEYLFQEGPHRLTATQHEFETFEGTEYHEPGTDDVLIVLKRRPQVAFRVIDDVAGQPVELFFFMLEKARTLQGGRSSGVRIGLRMEPESHPGGVVVNSADPRIHDYCILAPGFAPQRKPVEFDTVPALAEYERTVTIRLLRGGTLSGRLSLNGKMVPSPTISMKAKLLPLRPDVNGEPPNQPNRDWDYDLGKFAGSEQIHTGNEDGSFFIESLAAGTYEVSIRGKGAATVEIVAKIVEGETTELGEVSSQPSGKIKGTVFLAGGTLKEGFNAQLGTERFRGGAYAHVDPTELSFEFDDLDAGRHYVWFPAVKGTIVVGPPFLVDLEVGEIQERQFDLSDRVPATIELHLKHAGGEGAAEGFSGQSAGPRIPGSLERIEPTDEYGMTRATLLARPGVVLRVYSENGFLAGETPPLDLTPGQSEVVELELNPGRLRVRAPMPAEKESFGDLFWIMKSSKSGLGREINLPWTDRGDGWREIDIGLAAPGEFVLTLSPGDRLPDKKIEVEVIAGEEAVAVFD